MHMIIPQGRRDIVLLLLLFLMGMIVRLRMPRRNDVWVDQSSAGQKSNRRIPAVQEAPAQS